MIPKSSSPNEGKGFKAHSKVCVTKYTIVDGKRPLSSYLANLNSFLTSLESVQPQIKKFYLKHGEEVKLNRATDSQEHNSLVSD